MLVAHTQDIGECYADQSANSRQCLSLLCHDEIQQLDQTPFQLSHSFLPTNKHQRVVNNLHNYNNWVSRCLLKQRTMEVVVTTGAPVKSSPSTNQHPVFTGRMPFLSPNQQCQRLKGQYHIQWTCVPQAHLGVLQYYLSLLIAPSYLGGGLPCLSSALWCQYHRRLQYCCRQIFTEYVTGWYFVRAVWLGFHILRQSDIQYSKDPGTQIGDLHKTANPVI